MELTRKQLENIVKEVNPAIHGLFEIEQVKQLARQLVSELDNPKVWDGAPDNATHAEVWFGNAELVSNSPDKIYTRTLHKSPERELAEKIADSRSNQ